MDSSPTDDLSMEFVTKKFESQLFDDAEVSKI